MVHAAATCWSGGAGWCKPGANITDRIKVQYHSADNTVHAMVAEWGNYICGETLADEISFSSSPGVGVKSVSVGDVAVTIWIVAQS